MRYFIGFLGIVLGFFYLKYNYRVTNLLGRFPTIENYLGQGSTYLVHKIIAIVLIILSIMYAFGTLETGIQETIGPYFRGGR